MYYCTEGLESCTKKKGGGGKTDTNNEAHWEILGQTILPKLSQLIILRI